MIKSPIIYQQVYTNCIFCIFIKTESKVGDVGQFSPSYQPAARKQCKYSCLCGVRVWSAVPLQIMTLVCWYNCFVHNQGLSIGWASKQRGGFHTDFNCLTQARPLLCGYDIYKTVYLQLLKITPR